jgi:hypothetical protein
MNALSQLRKFKLHGAPRRRDDDVDEDELITKRSRRDDSNRNLRRKKSRRPNILENVKKQFPRLVATDGQTKDELDAEFIPYAKRAYDYYSQVAAVYMYLRAHLNDRTITYHAAGNSEAPHADKKTPDMSYKEEYDKALKSAATPGRFLKIKGGTVQLNIAPLSFNVICSLNEETIPIIQKKFSALFGNFIIPTKFERNDKKESVVVMDDYSTGLKPLQFYERLQFPQDEAPGRYQPAKLTTTDVIPKRIRETTDIEVKIHSTTLRNQFTTADSGPLNKSSLVNFQFRVMGVITLPLEFALWSTHATSLTEFVPKLYREHFDHMGQLALSIVKVKFEDMLARTMHVGKVKQLNLERSQEYGIKVKPRVNADNFCILKDGTTVYVPPADQAEMYVQALRNSYNPETGEVKNNFDIKEIHNIPLLTDWINDGFAYTDNNGTVQSIRLIGAIPLDEVTIFRDLGMQFDEISPKWREAFGSYGSTICKEFRLYDSSPSSNMQLAQDFQTLFVHLSGRYGHYPYHQMVSGSAGSSQDNDEIVNQRDRMLVQEFVRLCAAIAKVMAQSKSYAISTRINWIYYYHCFGIYIKNYKQYYNTYLESLEKNKPLPKSLVLDKFALPNLPGIKTVLPHQAEPVSQSIAKAPLMLVYDISAGGGKTFLLMCHILTLKQQGKVKVAIVVCPGQLIKEWTSEVNRASRGAINLVPINAEVIKKMVENLGFDRKRYIEYLRSMPINTIFVVSINFLSLAIKDHFTGERLGDYMQFGEQYIRFFPNVQLLRQLEPDLIALDESHYAKNLSSNRTLAMYGLAPTAKYRAVASGTIIQNDPGDMPAQYGLLNPACFGSQEDFQNRYGVVVNNKFVQLKDGMETEIAKVSLPYVHAVNKSRRDWAQLLPNIRASFSVVDLTAAQQEFYNEIMQEAVDKLQNDPGVKNLLKKQDQESQEKLEKLLERELNVVELFVNAPDTNPAFTHSENIKVGKRDLVSPKVRAVDQMIKRHFEVEKDPNKFIVFCYNREVSKHFWRHSEYQHMGIHYARAGSEPRNGSNSDAMISGDEALLKFRQDPNIKVLYADETSLREGLNLQVASEIARVQTLFAPGAQEQADSRAMRPDVMDFFKRKNITINWLITNRTHEVGKAARMIAKIITKHKMKERNNTQWHEFTKGTAIPNLSLITLNLEILRYPEYNTLTVDSDGNIRPSNLLKEYFDSYRYVNEWEDMEFDRARRELRTNTAKRLGIAPEKVNIRLDSQLPLDGSKLLPGSKSMWVPLVSGGQPVDNRDLNLKPLAVLAREDDDDDSDDDDGDVIDLIKYTEGTRVWTEYGWGEIKTILKKQIRVDVPGFNGGRPVTLSKQVLFTPSPPSSDIKSDEYRQWQRNVRQLEKDIERAGRKGITFMQGIGIPNPAQIKVPEAPQRDTGRNTGRPEPAIKPAVKPPIIVKRDDDEDEEPTTRRKTERNIPPRAPEKPPRGEDNGKRIFVDAMVVNGIPAVFAYADEDGFSRLEKHASWVRVPPFLNAQIKTYQGALNLVKWIKLNFPDTDNVDAPIKKHLDNFLMLAKRMRSQTSNNLRVRSRNSVPYADIANFTKIGHTPTKSTHYIKIFPIIWNDELFAAVPIGVQTQQASKLRSANIPGIEKFKKADEVAIHFSRNINGAHKVLDRLADHERLQNYNNTKALLENSLFKSLVGIR